MTYDLNGNTLNDGTNSYVWDARNRLASADGGGATFTYDPLGRRISRTILSANTAFLYDGVNPVQELNGSTVTANLLTGGIDERFLRTDGTGTLDYLTDALSSTIALTGSSGASNVQYSYGPFGSMSITGSTTSDYTYTGRESDGLGIYYYRARYYNPVIGRFISEDPIGFLGGINDYIYAGDDPMDFNDPLGLDKNAGRNCSVTPASAAQYAGAVGQVAKMTAAFFSGLGPDDYTFNTDSAVSQVMAQSAQFQDVLNQYYMFGTTSNWQGFGANGYVEAGENPVAQFLGSFGWSITPTNGGITVTLTNVTSFHSLMADHGSAYERFPFPVPVLPGDYAEITSPMGNIGQTISIEATCH
jgi:RHS repeat-associated protein